MTKTEHLNVIPLWVPANPNMLISISCDDVFLVGREDECGDEGNVTQDQGSARRDSLSITRCFVLRVCWCWMERITARIDIPLDKRGF